MGEVFSSINNFLFAAYENDIIQQKEYFTDEQEYLNMLEAANDHKESLKAEMTSKFGINFEGDNEL